MSRLFNEKVMSTKTLLIRCSVLHFLFSSYFLVSQICIEFDRTQVGNFFGGIFGKKEVQYSGHTKLQVAFFLF